MTVYLIDTDIIIYSLKGNTTVADHLRRHRTDPIMISVITYGEMVYGARKSNQTERNLATAHRVAEIYPMLPVTQSVIETFAGIRASLETAGTPLDDVDLLIGATSLSHNLTLVTNNEKHFSRIPGLSVENWAT
jgi:tRNA(fMet)-specific endonuclease VapC